MKNGLYYLYDICNHKSLQTFNKTGFNLLLTMLLFWQVTGTQIQKRSGSTTVNQRLGNRWRWALKLNGSTPTIYSLNIWKNECAYTRQKSNKKRCPYVATKIITFTERLIPSKQDNVYRYHVLVPSSKNIGRLLLCLILWNFWGKCNFRCRNLKMKVVDEDYFRCKKQMSIY